MCDVSRLERTRKLGQLRDNVRRTLGAGVDQRPKWNPVENRPAVAFSPASSQVRLPGPNSACRFRDQFYAASGSALDHE